MINAGDLRERVRLERFAGVDDGAGGQTDAWALVDSVWASVLPTGGREQLEAGALTGVQGFRVRIRWRSGLDTTNRFVWNGRALNIRSIEDPDGRREALLAFCESGVAQ